jgi:DNA-3-methyladenine glycosylase II
VPERLLAVPGPFRFDLALRYYASSPSTIAEMVTADTYERAFVSSGRPALLRVHGAPGGIVLQVDVDDPIALEQATTIATRAFGLADDPSGLVEIVARDPIAGRYVHKYLGLRPLAIPDPFEALVWAILGQQINIVFAAKLKRVLLERYGTLVERDGRAFLLFPRPEALADVTPEELRPLQFSRQKSVYVRELARALASGALDLESLRTLSDDEVVAELTRIKGIGRWTAEYLLLRGFGRPDAIPAGDMGLRAIVGRLYGYGRNASELEVRQLAEAWAPWRGYLAMYLWFALQQRDLPTT